MVGYVPLASTTIVVVGSDYEALYRNCRKPTKIAPASGQAAEEYMPLAAPSRSQATRSETKGRFAGRQGLVASA